MIQFDASGNRLSPAQVRQKHKGTTKSVIDPIKILNIYRTGPGPSKGGGRYDCEQFLGTRTRCKDRTGSILDDIEYIGRPANFGQVSAPRSKYFNPHVYSENPSRNSTNPATGNKYTRDEAVDYYEADIYGNCPAAKATDTVHDVPGPDTIKSELKGKNLLCWCSMEDRKTSLARKSIKNTLHRCHGDILSKIANEW